MTSSLLELIISIRNYGGGGGWSSLEKNLGWLFVYMIDALSKNFVKFALLYKLHQIFLPLLIALKLTCEILHNLTVFILNVCHIASVRTLVLLVLLIISSFVLQYLLQFTFVGLLSILYLRKDCSTTLGLITAKLNVLQPFCRNEMVFSELNSVFYFVFVM